MLFQFCIVYIEITADLFDLRMSTEGQNRLKLFYDFKVEL